MLWFCNNLLTVYCKSPGSSFTDLGCSIYISVDATGSTSMWGSLLITALMDRSHLPLLPVWTQILAPCSPTVSQIAQPCGCTPGGQANCSSPRLPIARHSCWPEHACCHLLCLLCSHTCFVVLLDFSYKTSSRRKLLRISIVKNYCLQFQCRQ